MANIKFDSTAFWDGFLVSLSAGMPITGEAPTKAEIEEFYGVKKGFVDALFGEKGRNYQVKFSDGEMAAFNAGAPPWDIRKSLLIATLWKSKAANECKALGVKLPDFVSTVEPSLSSALDDLGNWMQGFGAAGQLARQLSGGGFDAAVTESVTNMAAHFIGKITHSSAESGAVLVLPDCNPLPYLYSGTVGEIGLDKAVGSSQDTTFAKAKEAWLRVRENGKAASVASDIAVADVFERTLSRLGSGEDRPMNRFVDYRLRQIKLPRDGEYVAFTPLGSGGISKVIAGAKDEGLVSGEQTYLSVGGAKRSNVTQFDEIRRAYVFFAPAVSASGIATYLRLVNRGFKLYKTREMKGALDEYGTWLGKNGFVDDRNTFTAARIERQASIIRQIVWLALNQYREASIQVSEYIAFIKNDEEAEKAVSVLAAKGVIEKAIATGRASFELKEVLAKEIVKLIDGHRFKNKKDTLSIILSRGDRDRVTSNVSNIVSRYLGN